MPYDVYYDGHISIDPPLTEHDERDLLSILKHERTPATQHFFDAVAAEPEAILPPYGQSLFVEKDRSVLVPDEDESYPGVSSWIEILVKHFFHPRGYKLNGQFEWKGEDDDDRGCVYVKDQEVEVVENLILDPGPCWAPNIYAHAQLVSAIKSLLDSAENTGCSPDLTVVGAEHLNVIKALCAGLP